MLQCRQCSPAQTDHLVVPGKAHAQFDQIGTQVRDLINAFFPDIVGVGAHAKGTACVQGEVLPGLDAGFEDEGLDGWAVGRDENAGAVCYSAILEEEREGLQAREGGQEAEERVFECGRWVLVPEEEVC